MAARTWFTQDNTADLSVSDLAIINRAARRLADLGWLPTHSTLSEIRMTYRPGMSAKNVADIVDEKIS